MPLLAMASSAGLSGLYWLWVAASFQTTPLPLAGKGLTPQASYIQRMLRSTHSHSRTLHCAPGNLTLTSGPSPYSGRGPQATSPPSQTALALSG